MSNLYLGIDLGTSSLKVSLANLEGEILLSAKKNYPLIQLKPNWCEQDPNLWYQALLFCLDELNKNFDLRNVKSLSFSGQMHGLVILDENDNVIRNAILWNDSRNIDEVNYLNNIIGKDKLINETSNIALCGFTAPKLLWLKKHEYFSFKRIKKIMLPKDYLAYKLTGNFASDQSDLAGTLFFNVKEGKYSKFMLDLLDIKEEYLPKIYSSYEVVGNVKKELEESTHLLSSTKVVIGGGDQAVGGLGTNSLKEGELFLSLGTSGVVYAPCKNYHYDKLGRLHTFKDTNSNFFLMGCTLSFSGSLKWWIEDILETKDYNLETNDLPDEISNVIFLPYLVGERSPINDPLAKGSFSNLNSFYKRKDLTKAVIEGCCFSLLDNYLVMEDLQMHFSKAKAIGGGASEVVLQILADILGIKIDTINTKDGAALGAIILALVGDQQFNSLEQAADHFVKIKKTYIPNLEKHKKYLEKFKRYKQTYLDLKK